MVLNSRGSTYPCNSLGVIGASSGPSAADHYLRSHLVLPIEVAVIDPKEYLLKAGVLQHIEKDRLKEEQG
jgi:hypothetical protein